MYMPGEGSPIKKKERKFYKVSLRGASTSFCGHSYVSSSIFPGFYLKKGENNSGYFRLLVPQRLPNRKVLTKQSRFLEGISVLSLTDT